MHDHKALLALQAGLFVVTGAELDQMRGDLTLGVIGRLWYNWCMILRGIFTFVFAAILALTSVTLAVAQHGRVGGMTLVLCTSDGTQTVTLDANGNPVPMAHPCPDCVAALAAQDVPAALSLPMPPLAQQLLAVKIAAIDAPSQPKSAAYARGPPLKDAI